MPTESTHVSSPRSPGATEDTHSPSALGSVLTEPEHGEPPSCREREPTHAIGAARFHSTISIVQSRAAHHQKNWTLALLDVDSNSGCGPAPFPKPGRKDREGTDWAAGAKESLYETRGASDHADNLADAHR